MSRSSPVRAVLPGGRRHFQHGPIDLVIEAFGPPDETALAYAQAWTRFETVLGELARELPALRQPLSRGMQVQGPIASAMRNACAPHENAYVTPMAAVAGAVADAVMAALTPGRRLEKAYVNNGGDIALYLAPGQSLRAGIVTMEDIPSLGGKARIDCQSNVRGIATSGWRGRSHSLGIADSVTVLAGNAAMADVCATLIANAVNIEHPAVRRAPASSLDADSDLGTRLVTTEVGQLPQKYIENALSSGIDMARGMKNLGLIADALLALQGSARSLADAKIGLGVDGEFTIPDLSGLQASAGRGKTEFEHMVVSHDVS